MPLNLPTTTVNDISFGPGILKIGAAGATPTVEVGAIGEDGISIEFGVERRDIMQGNPKLPEYTFTQAQSVMVKTKSIQWSLNAGIPYGLGAGVTSSSSSLDTFTWGGDPIVQQVAIQIQHQMAITGNTLLVSVWKAVSESGFAVQLGADEHGFEYSYKAQRSSTNWAGAALAYREQLIQIVRQKT